jgi:GTPase SAR1 family protein
MRDHNKFSAHAPGLKDSLFYLREWIREYQDKILPDTKLIDVGNRSDSPEIIENSMLDT